MRKAFAETLKQIATDDPRVMLLTADLGFMALEEFAEALPDRFLNVGVAEANMVGVATGLAEAGFIPFVYSIASFASLRPYEQIRDGAVLHRLPVRVVGIGGGFEYGTSGVTHFAVEDLGVMRLQPGLTTIAPADSNQTRRVLRETYALPGPIYYRFGKNDKLTVPGLDGRFRLGGVETIGDGGDVALVAVGASCAEAVAAADILKGAGVRATVAVVSTLRPEPIEELRALLKRFRLAVSIETHYIWGGLGSLVAETIAEAGIACRLVRCGIRTMPSGASGSEAYMNKKHGLTAAEIAARTRVALDS